MDSLGQYDLVKGAIQQSFVDCGGIVGTTTLSAESTPRGSNRTLAPGVHMIDGLLPPWILVKPQSRQDRRGAVAS